MAEKKFIPVKVTRLKTIVCTKNLIPLINISGWFMDDAFLTHFINEG